MPNKKGAKFDIVKAIAGVSFTTLAAIGGSTGHPLLAGLAAIPAAGLTAHNTLNDRLAKLKSQKEKYLEIPSPFWWASDFRSWQNLCTEVENHFLSNVNYLGPPYGNYFCRFLRLDLRRFLLKLAMMIGFGGTIALDLHHI